MVKESDVILAILVEYTTDELVETALKYDIGTDFEIRQMTRGEIISALLKIMSGDD